jgi:hypothetical protein
LQDRTALGLPRKFRVDDLVGPRPEPLDVSPASKRRVRSIGHPQAPWTMTETPDRMAFKVSDTEANPPPYRCVTMIDRCA